MKILFIKQNCSRCEKIKKALAESNLLADVKLVDVETKEGLAVLAWYEKVTDAEEKLPILHITEDEDTEEYMKYADVLSSVDLDKKCEDGVCNI
jgi:predicted DCC family thiol-disulfide oxidoreductase YuxK